LVAAGLSTGCSEKEVTGPELSIPSVTAVSVADAGSPIFRTISVSLDRPGAVAIEYWGEAIPRLRINSESEVAMHELFLPRLRAASVYYFEIWPLSPSGIAGDIVSGSGSFNTDSLPPELAAIQAQIIGSATFPLLMIQLLGELPFSDPDADHQPLPIIMDTDGYIVWYRPERGKRTQGFARLANGNFVFNTPMGLEVVTPDGRLVTTLTEESAATRSGRGEFNIHHDVTITPSNTVLFPVQGGSVTVRDTVWTGEEIWEWDPTSDALSLRWSSGDFLSPEREADRGPFSRPADWLHANSVSVGPRGNILVSLFLTNEVLSIAPDYQSIEWRLGGAASSFSTNDLLQSGQHTAAEVSPNRVLMLDNGRWGRPNGADYSRALEVQLDHDAGTAEVVWEFRPLPDIYAPIISSAYRIENGNSVVGFGTPANFRSYPSTGPV
jgi:hypothetical protein